MSTIETITTEYTLYGGEFKFKQDAWDKIWENKLKAAGLAVLQGHAVKFTGDKEEGILVINDGEVIINDNWSTEEETVYTPEEIEQQNWEQEMAEIQEMIDERPVY
ncbi:hypothetical protein FDI69_gp127 [Rhodococcus phage Trina]|uniref:Uncharacterized protein n=1 Tax=Rhodococcus phage Trina TaxID=2027905 RepID=A0A2D0ZNT2_9CAUD|nr:hypothetical protein FDI69_gp127 [Rhodococcus phage Trina]ASZ75058.1 hypothetical protein SEA_TRINA_280 [Rhodococcus phage Trina]